MSGENSKSSGETGENIIDKFFNIVGWKNANPNISFPCLRGEKHTRANAKKQKRELHGIDVQYAYLSGLESDTLINILGSVKHTKNSSYPMSLTSLVKNHIKDILDAETCYRVSPLRQELNRQFYGKRISKVRNVPVLFFLSSHDEPDTDYLSRIANTRYVTQDFDIEEFYIVDNKKLSFILDAISYLKSAYPQHDIYFHHANTSLNMMDYDKPPYSKTLPVEYLGSSYINFLLKKGENGEEVFTFITITQENFSEDALSNYIFSAQEHTSKIASSYGVGFADYYSDDHVKDVNKALTKHNLSIEKR